MKTSLNASIAHDKLLCQPAAEFIALKSITGSRIMISWWFPIGDPRHDWKLIVEDGKLAVEKFPPAVAQGYWAARLSEEKRGPCPLPLVTQLPALHDA
jgi:hypothetical protein